MKIKWTATCFEISPASLWQRYGVLATVLFLGLFLAGYARVIERHEQLELLNQTASRLLQPQSYRLNDRLVDIERDAGKLRALLDTLPSLVIADAENYVDVFNRYQASAVRFKIIKDTEDLGQKISEGEYRAELYTEGSASWLNISTPLKHSGGWLLNFKVNLTEIVNSMGSKPPILHFSMQPSSRIEKKVGALSAEGEQAFNVFSAKLWVSTPPIDTTHDVHYFSIALLLQLGGIILIAVGAQHVMRREKQIRDVVRYRTRELAAANASLANEIAGHRLSARQTMEGEQQLRAIADALPMAIFEVNASYNIQFINKTGVAWMEGVSFLTKEGVGLEGLDWLHSLDEKGQFTIRQALEEAAEGGDVHQFLEKVVFNATKERYLTIQALPKRDNRYSHIGAYLILTDVSDQIEAQENTQRSHENHKILSELGQYALAAERIESVFDEAVQQIAIALKTDKVAMAQFHPTQDHFFQIVASSCASWKGVCFSSPLYPSIQRLWMSEEGSSFDSEETLLFITTEEKKLCATLWVPVYISKQAFGFLVIQRNKEDVYSPYEIYLVESISNLITQAMVRYLAEVRLFNEKERAEVTLASITDAVVTTNEKGLIEFMNSSAEKMVGWTREEVVGQPIQRVLKIAQEEGYEYVRNPLEECLETGKVVMGNDHLILYNRHGHERGIDCSAAPLHTPSGSVMGGVLVFRDVTSQRQLSHQLSHQATHDALTGLINRFEFERRLNHILSIPPVVGDEENENALLYLDLDQFKVVNDTCGHAAGDALLRQLSAVLLQKLRKRDTLARLGGDEFAVLLEHCPAVQAERIANELKQTVSDFRFPWDGKAFRVGVSIGLINFGRHSTSLGQLLSAADTACYIAKESGRDRVHVSRLNDTPLSEAHHQMNWVARLQQALEENRFELFAQKIQALNEKPNEPRHYEVLIRLWDESQKIILPGAFIPAAERYNLMTQIDRWVIHESLKWLAVASTQPIPPIVLGLNLSGRSLGDETLLPFIRRHIQEYAIDPGQLCFEITETAAITNMHVASRLIEGLRDMGCHFALDDFGSGMSSFGYLKNLQVDYLKIDGNFVKNLILDPIDWVMVESISKVGQAMGLHVIAEYAETDAIIHRLRDLGVDYAQGYGIGKPMPLSQIIR